MSEWRGAIDWPELVDPPTEVKEGDRLLIRWKNGREEMVTVDHVEKARDGYRLDVAVDPPPDLPQIYREPPRP